MQLLKRHGRLFCSHKYLRGSGTIIFLGDSLESKRQYFYQAQCSKCGKQVRIIGTAEEIETWRDKKEVN